MSDVTPVRQQYLQIKARHPDAIVFFRLGDFYETFDKDAEIAARELDLVLTSRPVSKTQRVPMAGVPYHAVESYIARLIEKGYRVAIAEQVGEVSGAGLVAREVTRVVTPGTVVEPALLDERRPNYLAALVVEGAQAGLAHADITTGEFATTQLNTDEVVEELARLQPRECLVSESAGELPALAGLHTLFPNLHLTPLPAYRFELGLARQVLLDHFGVATLDGFGCAGKPLALQAAGAIIHYLRDTGKGLLANITTLSTYSTARFMTLDPATRRNLELTETIRERKTRGSLLGVLDLTLTPMGGRLLRTRLAQPLLDRVELERRLDEVEAFYNDAVVRGRTRELLKNMPDLERLTNRVLTGIATPRDLLGIRRALEALPGLVETLAGFLPQASELDPCSDVAGLIASAIVDDPPASISAGGVIRPGFSAELDGIVTASQEARQWIAGLEKRERERTGIKSLKVGYNKVFGYYLEVTKANLDSVPADYIRKQTLVNAERFITPELKEYESLILHAEERQVEVETRLFHDLCRQISAQGKRLLHTARTLASIDVAAALAEVAVRNRYVRPTIGDDDTLEIIAGRHPVVEQMLQDEPFVPNDLRLNQEERILIITGPNMAGKCVDEDTLLCTEHGLLRIGDLRPAQAQAHTFTALQVGVCGKDGYKTTSHFYDGGCVPVVRVTTSRGYELIGTPEHRLWVCRPDGTTGWVPLSELARGDCAALKPDTGLWGGKLTLDIEVPAGDGCRYPDKLTPELAYLTGLLTGSGNLRYRRRIVITLQDEFTAQEFCRVAQLCFGYQPLPESTRDGSTWTLSVASADIRRFMAELGLGYACSCEKEIPRAILQSPREMTAAFLQGLFDASASADARDGHITFSTPSPRLVRQVQLLLLNHGIISSLRIGKVSGRPSYQLTMHGRDALAFYERIGFRSSGKQAHKELLQDCPHERDTLSLESDGLFYDAVISVEPAGVRQVYDLSVPDGNAYVAAGFVSHNSVFLRQNALIVLMAQIGSFVPAERAHIGIVDRIFTRIGAQDEVASGQSTFMVEMVETANILNHATPRSLLILDEIGRGTSTYDGLSIAWAVVEYLHNHPERRARTLFATHYHELTEIANRLPAVRNYNLAVIEEGNRVIFLHKVVPGGADRSYGIHVAQLAGVPRPVISRAEELLARLESGEFRPGTPAPQPYQPLLFVQEHPVIEEIRALDITSMTPLEALNKLYEFQRLVNQNTAPQRRPRSSTRR